MPLRTASHSSLPQLQSHGRYRSPGTRACLWPCASRNLRESVEGRVGLMRGTSRHARQC